MPVTPARAAAAISLATALAAQDPPPDSPTPPAGTASAPSRTTGDARFGEETSLEAAAEPFAEVEVTRLAQR